MLRIPSLLQAVLLVIVALTSSVHGLGLQDPSATSELVQGHQDTEDAVSIGAGAVDDLSELSGGGRDLQGFGHGGHKKIIFRHKPKKHFFPKKKFHKKFHKKPVFHHKPKFFHHKKKPFFHKNKKFHH